MFRQLFAAVRQYATMVCKIKFFISQKGLTKAIVRCIIANNTDNIKRSQKTMRNQIICAISGKNIEQIGNGRSETYYKNEDIKLSISQNISEFIENGVTDFLCNCEYGFPLWAVEHLISLRNIRMQQDLRAFRLHIVVPHERQASDWSDDIHERYFDVIDNADSVLQLYRQYRDDCYENCERFMIGCCDFVFTDDENDFAAQYAQIHDKSFVVCKVLQCACG